MGLSWAGWCMGGGGIRPYEPYDFHKEWHNYGDLAQLPKSIASVAEIVLCSALLLALPTLIPCGKTVVET